MLVIDHVLTDNLCNLRCTYCPCDVTQLQRSGQQIRTRKGREGPPPENIDDFLERTVSVIERVNEHVNAPVLKVSGGEIFLVPEFLGLLPSLCERFAVIQILTNGTRLTDATVAQLSKFKNVCLQISLDGHTYEMNRFRFTSPVTFTSALDGLLRSVRAKIPVEINTVLTAGNIDEFWGFVRFLSEATSGHALVCPFPVRGKPDMFPTRDQIEGFCLGMSAGYAHYDALLPPQAYMRRLCEFLRSGFRRSGCSVPFAVIGSNGDGTLDACTCGPVKVLGNVLDGDGSDALDKIKIDPCYEKVQIPRLMPHCCHDCFTHYDILNLFVEGAISEQELAKLPFFGNPQVLAALRAVRETTAVAKSSGGEFPIIS